MVGVLTQKKWAYALNQGISPPLLPPRELVIKHHCPHPIPLPQFQHFVSALTLVTVSCFFLCLCEIHDRLWASIFGGSAKKNVNGSFQTRLLQKHTFCTSIRNSHPLSHLGHSCGHPSGLPFLFLLQCILLEVFSKTLQWLIIVLGMSPSPFPSSTWLCTSQPPPGPPPTLCRHSSHVPAPLAPSPFHVKVFST